MYDKISKALGFLLIIISYDLYGCICNTIPFEKEYEESEIIFLANVIESNSEAFTLVVLEYLKGSSSDTLRGEVKGSCSIYPQTGETWLVYGKLEQEIVTASNCGSSRPFSNFYSDNGFFPEPGPIEMTKSQSHINGHVIYGIELAEFYFEISTMRHRRLQSIIEDSLKKENDTEESGNKFIYIGLALSLLLNFIILFRLKKSSP